jgi:hypothetical protein
LLSNNEISIQTISTNVNYKETGSTGTMDTEKGDVPGFGAAISIMGGEDNKYLLARYSQVHGQTSYVGMPLTGGTYGSVLGTTAATLTDYSIRYGKGFSLKDYDGETMLTPFFEVGNHQWVRGLPTYEESYANDYFGIGVLGQYSPLNSKLVLSASALWGSTFRASLKTSLLGSNIAESLQNSTINEYGLSADLELISHLHGNISVDFDNFNYGNSAASIISINGTSYYILEPNSTTSYTTSYTTIKLGLAYAF